MIAPESLTAFPESLRSPAPFEVSDSEYRRLLGYPRAHEPSERAHELVAQARQWYAENGKPWRYFREAELNYTNDTVLIDGAIFRSPGLYRRLRAANADRIILALASSGAGLEERARALWNEGKPDEYFFLEMFGSAVVESLVAGLNGELCALASRDGRFALPHYSPGYTEWDVAEQVPLFGRLLAGLGAPFPEPLRVLPSGMIVPRKALLAVIGLTRHAPAGQPHTVPCLDCNFAPCQYRRAPFRHSLTGPAVAAAAPAAYRIGAKALRKWASERVALTRRENGEVNARFRFDGTTCSNMGQPLAFEYELDLAPGEAGLTIRRATCAPALGDEGYRKMCAFLNDEDGLMEAIATETPRVGLTLDAALAEASPGTASGCHCTSDGRAHKWSMALQAIHYALNNSP